MQVPAYQSQRVFQHVREGILRGVFPGGGRLPPSRVLAGELGVARQTVVVAYERLAAEGYVRARVGAGTFVTADLPDARPDPVPQTTLARPRATALSRRGAAVSAVPTSAVTSHSLPLLAPGIPAAELFPSRAWAACAAAACRAQPGAGYPDPQGMPELRAAIAEHLAVTRGLVADPARILITAGTQQALRIVAELLTDPGDAVWVEEPGYIAGRGAMLAAGAVPIPVPSDDAGLDVAAGRQAAPHARLALLAPSHATPLGGAMPVARRLAMLEWAAAAESWVIEDDCDAEFRWAGKPLPPLASLEGSDRVVYCGTFSKTLSPSLRLGFAVFPAALIGPATRLRTLWDRGPGEMVQATLAEFMRRGLLVPHIRRMRTEYARRRDAVVAGLAAHCPALGVLPAPGGLHMAALLPEGADEAQVAAAAHRLGLGVAPGAAYRLGTAICASLVMGFAATPTPLASHAARALAKAIREGTSVAASRQNLAVIAS